MREEKIYNMEQMEKPYLSIIIPAYNEEKRIGKTLLAINEYLTKQDYSYEILVVDGGSSDKTIEIIKKFQKSIENLRFIIRKEEFGKGYVVREGILEARGEFRLFTDADNSTPIDQIEKFWPYFQKGYDIVIGSRALKESEIKIRQPWFREMPGRLSNILIQIIAVSGIKDTQCGFKCFTAKVAQDIFKRSVINRWGFDIEILAIGRMLGYKIKEVPVVWINDPNSKVSWKDYLTTLEDLFMIKWNLIKRKYS